MVAPGPTKPPGGLPGRVASSIVARKVEFLLEPYLARGMVSFLVGEPESGKSTVAAWMMRAARRTILLPGREENFESITLPRLLANGIRLDDVLVLDDGEWIMPRAREELVRVVKVWGADLVIADPIDTYRSESGSEDNGPHVREFLECWARIGNETGASILGIRHPGKDPGNVCPGSRQWRAVPRVIIELVPDPDGSGMGIIRKYKDSLGQDIATRRYKLDGLPGEPRVFMPGNVVASLEAAALKETADRQERSVLEECKVFLRDVLKDKPMEAAEIYAMADKLKLSPRTLRLAAISLGITKTPKGFGKEYTSEWSL